MKHFCFFFLIVKVSYNFGDNVKTSNSDVVTTKFADISGTDINFSTGTVTQYLGLPYAYPPIGSLRFKNPVELGEKKLNTTYYAIHLAGACPQIIKKMGFSPYDDSLPKNGTNENCLKFNMWVPKGQTNMPVLVFFHGGIFTGGTTSIDKYNGSVLALTTNSIVITPNYRLGIFGFAYLKNGAIPGNMGLKDQQVLLKWIHETISLFGGDKNQVTIFGFGSGSSCVSAHLFSNDSKPYFKRAIMSSGTITHFQETLSTDTADTNTRNVSKILGCIEDIKNPGKTDDKILECLQKKTVQELLDAAKIVKVQGQPSFTHRFYFTDNDGGFFKESVKEIAKNKTFNKEVELIVGRTADEGSYFMTTGMLNNSYFGCQFYPHLLFTDPKNLCEMSEQNFKNLIKYGGSLVHFNESEIEKLEKIYFNSANSYTNRSIRILSDFAFDCALSKFGIDYSIASEKSVYFYDHVRRSPINPWPVWTGAMHGDDMLDIFGMPFRHPEKYPQGILQNEQDYSKKVMEAIGQFMKTGNPSEKWKKGTGTAPDALALNGQLNFDSNTAFIKFRPKTCDEFDNLFKESMLWKIQQKALQSQNN